MSMKMDDPSNDRESLTTSYRIAANPGFLPDFCADRQPHRTSLPAHDLVRKPVPIPDQVEDMLFGIMRYRLKN
jgi:hypothetical protein